MQDNSNSHMTRRKTFKIIHSQVDISSGLRNCRLYIPKEVRETLDWNQTFESGSRMVFWYDPAIDNSTAIISTIHSKDYIDFSRYDSIKYKIFSILMIKCLQKKMK